MAKRVDLSIDVILPEGHSADRLSIGADGRVSVFDKEGNLIEPVSINRSAHYSRAKGPKIQTQSLSSNGETTVGGLAELAKLDSFITVDVNSAHIAGVKVSAAFFFRAKLVPVGDGEYRVLSLDGRGHVYEFHDVPGNPEMLAILRIANDIQKHEGENQKIGFITDSELGSLGAISGRHVPIYGEHFLPANFPVIYASADTGGELANRIIRFCDKESTKYLQRLKGENFRRSGLVTLEEDPSVRFRYTYFPSLEIGDTPVRGVPPTPETTWTMYGHRNK